MTIELVGSVYGAGYLPVPVEARAGDVGVVCPSLRAAYLGVQWEELRGFESIIGPWPIGTLILYYRGLEVSHPVSHEQPEQAVTGRSEPGPGGSE